MKTLLKISASWCVSCKTLANLFKDIDFTGIEVINIDADSDASTVKQYNVRGIPALILLDETGEEIKRKIGIITKDDLLQFLKD